MRRALVARLAMAALVCGPAVASAKDYKLTLEQRRGMLHLRHAFRTRPHFVAFWVNQLPAPAPWIARNVFGLPLLTWTVRTAEQRERAARYADQVIFEGFVPGT